MILEYIKMHCILVPSQPGQPSILSAAQALV